MMVRAEVVTNARSQLVSQLVRGQDAARLGHCSLAMYPLRLYVVQPGAFGRQEARNNLNARLSFSPATKHLLVVPSYPATHLSADVPRSVVPRLSMRRLLEI